MAEREKKYALTQNNVTGLSDDSRIGDPGAVRYMIGADVRTDSGILQIAALPVKDSDSTVDQEVDWMEPNPANNDMYMYGQSEIYKETGGTYSLARTLSSDSPASQGLCDFNGYLYYRTATQLGRFDYSSTWTDNWQTGLTSCAKWSPMIRFKSYMLVGHGRYIGTVDDQGYWTAQRITLPPGYNIRSFFIAGSQVGILAIRGNAITDSDEGFLFMWDGYQSTYTDWIPLSGNPHAGIAYGQIMMIIAGDRPKINKSAGAQALVYMEIPNIAKNKTIEIYPGAIEIFDNLIHIGISDGTDTSVVRGVYTYGAKNVKFNDALVPTYRTSQGVITGTGVKITAIRKVAGKLRFAWVSGGTYGIDEVDFTKYQASAVIRSLAYDRSSPYIKIGQHAIVEFTDPLAANESVTLKLSTRPYADPTFAGSDVISQTESTVGATRLEIPLTQASQELRGTDIHYELTLASSDGLTSPGVKRTVAQFEEQQDDMLQG